MMYKFIKRTSGFTLVELLIVIALLAAIALIVIAAINPVEQSNRARDTRFASDSGQVVSAIERYYTGQNKYPWVGQTGGPNSNDLGLAFTRAGAQLVGICGATCASDGILITNNELKQEFRNRDFIRNSATGANTDLILVGKAAGSNAGVYACFIPLSNSTRQKACAENNVYQFAEGATTRGNPVSESTCSGSSFDWTGSPAAYVCLPQ